MHCHRICLNDLYQTIVIPVDVGVVSMMDGTKLLSDGRRIPVLGLGTYLAAESQVTCALKEGYRLIDTATLYE